MAVVGVAIDPVLNWALQRGLVDVALSGSPSDGAIGVLTYAESAVLGVIAPLMVLTPLVAAGIVWFVRQGRESRRPDDVPVLAADEVGDSPA